MAHADWLITGLENVILPSQETHLKKFILPARENIEQINF